jgi:hypothetical protein
MQLPAISTTEYFTEYFSIFFSKYFLGYFRGHSRPPFPARKLFSYSRELENKGEGKAAQEPF